VAALRDDPCAIELVDRLTDAGALVPCPLTSRLAQLHGATVAPATGSAISPAVEDARLIRESGGCAACELPRPELHASLETAIGLRRTVRIFTGAPVSLRQLSALLQFGAGCNDTPLPAVPGGPAAGRVYPSAGSLYPVEVLVRPLRVEELSSRYCRYQPASHRLVRSDDRADDVSAATQEMLDSNGIAAASLVMLLWADFTRPSLGKYGEKAYRFVLLEAGHLAQNVLLVAAAVGLAGVPICGFDDEALALEAGLAYPRQVVLYALALGVPPSNRSPAREQP